MCQENHNSWRLLIFLNILMKYNFEYYPTVSVSCIPTSFDQDTRHHYSQFKMETMGNFYFYFFYTFFFLLWVISIGNLTISVNPKKTFDIIYQDCNL